jgi:hypothetical protein
MRMTSTKTKKTRRLFRISKKKDKRDDDDNMQRCFGDEVNSESEASDRENNNEKALFAKKVKKLILYAPEFLAYILKFTLYGLQRKTRPLPRPFRS